MKASPLGTTVRESGMNNSNLRIIILEKDEIELLKQILYDILFDTRHRGKSNRMQPILVKILYELENQ